MNNKIKNMAGIAIFSAIIIVFQLIASYIKIGTISITLALFPIAIGAIIYGPTAGFILGLVNGIMVLLDSSTQVQFLASYPIQTIIVCLLKTSLAGLVAGYIYKWLKNKNFTLSIIIASISVPLINTTLFSLAMITVFKPLLDFWASGENVFSYLLLSLIGFNFIIEFVINSALAPTAITLAKIKEKIM